MSSPYGRRQTSKFADKFLAFPAGERVHIRSIPDRAIDDRIVADHEICGALLSQLALAGANLRYHGDFDWPGLQIGNVVMREWNAKPWRFGASDYLASVAEASEFTHPLEGAPVTAIWDDDLASAMQHRGIAIAEEGMVRCLIADLDMSWSGSSKY